MEKYKRYIIQNSENGMFISDFDTLAEAELELKDYEQQDKDNDCYTIDYYEIAELIDGDYVPLCCIN